MTTEKWIDGETSFDCTWLHSLQRAVGFWKNTGWTPFFGEQNLGLSYLITWFGPDLWGQQLFEAHAMFFFSGRLCFLELCFSILQRVYLAIYIVGFIIYVNSFLLWKAACQLELRLAWVTKDIFNLRMSIFGGRSDVPRSRLPLFPYNRGWSSTQ